VAANQASDTVTVRLGVGDGTFRGPLTFAVDRGPNSVTVGDVNRDGNPDLLTANLYGGSVSVLLRKGTGEFLPADTFAVGEYPSAVRLGDFNEATFPDLAVTDALDPFGVLLILPNAADWEGGHRRPARVGAEPPTDPWPVEPRVPRVVGSHPASVTAA